MFGPELQLMTSYGIRFASKLATNTTCDCSNAVRENMDVHSRSSYFFYMCHEAITEIQSYPRFYSELIYSTSFMKWKAHPKR